MRNTIIYSLFNGLRDFFLWSKRGYSSPSPHFIKQSCLLRNGIPSATWVETGTFLGQTTQLLAKRGSFVFSIEPEPRLFDRARILFSKNKNVKILNGTSEDLLPTLLPSIVGDVNFWLDGHYSAGITFKGRHDTPILHELDSISNNIDHFGKICVSIDDVRCFQPRLKKYEAYPSLDTLVAWATKHHLYWHIEHDIFIATNY